MRKIEKGMFYTSFIYAVPDGEYIWYVDFNSSILMRLCIETGEIIPEAVLGDSFAPDMYTGIIKKENALYLFPDSANKVLKYDLSTKKLLSIYKLHETKYGNFGYGGKAVVGNEIFLVSCWKDICPIKIDLRNDKVYKLDHLKRYLKEVYTEGNKYTTLSIFSKDRKLWIAIDNTNTILVYDVDSEERELVILNKDTKINKIYDMEDYMIAILYQGGIVSYSYKEKISKILFSEELYTMKFVDLVRIEQDVLLIPRKGKKFVKIFDDFRKIEYITVENSDLINISNKEEWFRSGLANNGEYHIFPYHTNGYIKINKYTSEVTMIRSVQCIDEFMKNTLSKINGYIKIFEQRNYLDGYINYFSHVDNRNKNCDHNLFLIGDRVFQICKEEEKSSG